MRRLLCLSLLLCAAASIVACTPSSEPSAVDREPSGQETAHPPEAAGVYDIEATLGEVTVPGRLDLESHEAGFRGRLTLQLGTPLYVALRSTGAPDDTLRFATSAPATGMALTVEGDTLGGRLGLTGGRMVSVAGARRDGAALPEAFAAHFALQPFAPGVVSTTDRGEAFPSLSPDGKTLYVSTYAADFASQTIMVARAPEGEWTALEVASFSGTYSDRSPSVAPDGQRLLFASTRPLPGDSAAGDYNLWMLRADAAGGWSAPEPLATVNSDAADYQPTLAADGTLYFTSEREGGQGGQDLYRARWDGRQYQAPEHLGSAINTDESEMSSFISPDGSYLVFATSAGHPGHVGNDDLYISVFRDGLWTAPRNLGQPINSFANEYGPTVSGGYLYFTSDRHPPANIYRVPVETLGLE
ncbi:MAG: hypothetical protein GVY18_18560 [Bacteroidetes bacterium]|jgi:hypothetical protein|nr:hypothetical protein [Bacteroidota bacterium]